MESLNEVGTKIFPINSCKGYALKNAAYDSHLCYQNLWYVIDASGDSVNTNSIPKLGEVETSLDGTHLTIAFTGMFFRLSLTVQPKRTLQANIEGLNRTVYLEPDLYSQALSKFVGADVRLVRL